jgi:hypothetical protein
MEEDSLELDLQLSYPLHGEQAIVHMPKENLKKLQKSILKRTCKLPIKTTFKPQ